MIVPGRSVHLHGVSRPSAPDDRLLAAARGGDATALDELVRACLPTVLAWCTRLGGPRVAPDDAAQDVMLVLLSRLSTVPDPDHLRPWLYGVTRRVLADHRKRAWFRRWLPGVFVDVADRAPDPALRCELSELARAVQVAIDAMPLAQRELFVLCDVEQYTDTEAARMVGVPVGTVKSRLRLARARFRAATEGLERPPSRRARAHSEAP